ncbi:(2Fe-2S)-binding protein (plasmid) [Streptomyces sp. BI20]|uniref:(2Fe-2S)-binding protein n=1 Tax=Streptomyces sp. BI20 TaxID=3403460 RepID=UPI003C730A0E
MNGTPRTAPADPRTSLADLVRHGHGLTGTHVGCEQAVCGACVLLLDGVPVRSCAVLAVQAEGACVETVESLAPDPPPGSPAPLPRPTGPPDPHTLSPLQEALREHHGLQCGFCTPGLLMALTWAEREGLSLEETLEEVLPGHLCRCTGYAGIRAAVTAHRNRKEPPR